MIARARIAAYDALSAVSANRADLPTALARTRASLPDVRDQALAADIATGVQRHRAALDHVIAAYAGRPLARLDAQVVDILRMSAYQLLHLSRVPAAAIVDDAVELARKAGKRSADGFVNALLRRISRTRHELPLPPRPQGATDRSAALDYFSITLSHPRWLAARWHDRLGFGRAEAWMLFNNQPAPLALRANRLRLTRDVLQIDLAAQGVVTRAGRFAPDALLVESGRPLQGRDSEDNRFIVQDEASQLVTLLAGESPGPRVLDTCAAPGGKATAIAASLTSGQLLIACDLRARRMNLLLRTISASGAANVRLVQADAARALPFQRAFSTVIVDAPCSGLGTLRRDPDIRWRRAEADLPPLAAAQQRMLDQAAGCVAPGGRLVYATCSSEPEENEWVVDAFLQRHGEFVPIDASQAHPLMPAGVVDARGHLRTEPDRHALEAFFGAAFERAGQL